MKKLVVPACVLGLILCSRAGAEPPREASEILKEYHAIKMPVVDQAKVSDPAWVQSYLKERTAAVEKQNELALELYKANPDHPEAGKLLAARWNNMAARSPAT